MEHMVSIFDGNQTGYTVNLDSFGRNVVTMGRDSENDIVIGCFRIPTV